MSAQSRRSIQPAQQPEQDHKPLCRLQNYLVETKTSMALFREVLIEFKDTLSIITVIVFFALGVYEAVKRMLGWP
jgi:hypothetical protein